MPLCLSIPHSQNVRLRAGVYAIPKPAAKVGDCIDEWYKNQPYNGGAHIYTQPALAVFEFVTTLDQEVVSVWKREWTGASLLLFAVRYTMLAVAIGNCVTFVNMNYQGCVIMSITTNILALLDCLLTALFSALRVYALCGGSIRLSAATLLLQVSPIIVNAYSYIGDTYTSDPVVGCLFSYPFGLKTQEILVLASRIPLALGDALVVIITWMKSLQQFKVQRNLGMHLPLSTLLFRDGTVYFLILLILNILEPCPLTSSDAGYVISELNGSLPLILVNRFMLNLRQLSDDETRSAPHIRTITTPIFQMSIDIAGNIGESLEHGYETEARGEDGVELQVGQQDEEMLELQESLRDDRHNTQEVPQGDEEAGPSRCLSE